jgi:lysozyme
MKRRVLVVLTLLAAVGLVSPSGAEGPWNPPPTPTFSDVGTNHDFYMEIEWNADVDITNGYSDGTFRPANSVSRQAVAAFLYRFADLADDPSIPFSPPATPTFSDVSTSHPFFTEIEWMVDQDLTAGYADGTFRPGNVVSRQAYAAFLARTIEDPFWNPPSTPTFSDVPTNHQFYSEIEFLAHHQITLGYADGTFRPTNDVSRQASASLIFWSFYVFV